VTGSIHKKGQAYYLVFRHVDASGRRRQKWVAAGRSKREAEKRLTELMGEIHAGTYRELKKSTFAGFARVWLESYARTRTKPSTLKSYETIINANLIPAFGDMAMTDITAEIIQRYVTTRLERVKPKTVINELVPLKEMLKHAVRWGYLKLNPAREVERPRIEREEMAYLTPKEVNLFLRHVTPRYHALFLTAVMTGLRRGELLALRWGDVDWNNNQLWVRRSLWKGQLLTPKSKLSARRVDLTPSLIIELKKHKLASPISPQDLVFCNADGNPWEPDALVKRQFLPALRRAGIRQVRFHDLRHTNVALRLAQGQPIKYIQHQLGHSSIQTTLDRYGHLMPDIGAEQAMKLDNILDRGSWTG